VRSQSLYNYLKIIPSKRLPNSFKKSAVEENKELDEKSPDLQEEIAEEMEKLQQNLSKKRQQKEYLKSPYVCEELFSKDENVIVSNDSILNSHLIHISKEYRTAIF
jgi:FMN-dependent NADH-azoreductase